MFRSDRERHGPVTVRDMGETDLGRVRALNNSAVPALGYLELDLLKQFVDWAEPALVAASGGASIGFVLVLGPGLSYRSENYRWFDSCYSDFAYVDRVVVDEPARRRGIAGVWEQAGCPDGQGSQQSR